MYIKIFSVSSILKFCYPVNNVHSYVIWIKSDASD